MHENFTFAFLLTLFAGLSTGIGSFLAFITKRTDKSFLAVALGFSAGVMIYVSMGEIMLEARESLIETFGKNRGLWYVTISFFAGMLIVAIIDKLVPDYENPHEAHEVTELGPDFNVEKTDADEDKKLHRMGVLSAIAIAVHNFPEGLVTFLAALSDPVLGTGIAIAIAIHNVPEGVAISVPIYHATGSRRKAFAYSFLSGMAEPLGALAGYFLFFRYIDEGMLGIVFAAVAGIMVFISHDQLLPTAEKYGKHHLCIYGLVAGMMVMAISILLLETM